MQCAVYGLDRMECLGEVPTSWDAPGATYPRPLDPVFAPCRPYVHTGKYAVSDYVFRTAAALLAAEVRVRDHPRVLAALGGAQALVDSLFPGRWALLADVRRRNPGKPYVQV